MKLLYLMVYAAVLSKLVFAGSRNSIQAAQFIFILYYWRLSSYMFRFITPSSG
jgi:hypothetical protein